MFKITHVWRLKPFSPDSWRWRGAFQVGNCQMSEIITFILNLVPPCSWCGTRRWASKCSRHKTVLRKLLDMEKIGRRDLGERSKCTCQSFVITTIIYQYHVPARQHWKVKNISVGHHKRLDSQSQHVATSTRFATKYTILSPKNTCDLRVKGHTILIFIFSVNSVLSWILWQEVSEILCLFLASKFHRCVDSALVNVV